MQQLFISNNISENQAHNDGFDGKIKGDRKINSKSFVKAFDNQTRFIIGAKTIRIILNIIHLFTPNHILHII